MLLQIHRFLTRAQLEPEPPTRFGLFDKLGRGAELAFRAARLWPSTSVLTSALKNDQNTTFSVGGGLDINQGRNKMRDRVCNLLWTRKRVLTRHQETQQMLMGPAMLED